MSNRIAWALVIVLGLVLVTTNAWWLYLTMDEATIAKYREQMLSERTKALEAALAVAPSLSEDLTKDEVIAIFVETLEERDEEYEKDGVIVVGFLTLRFSDSGRLVEVGTPFPID